jgi:membrane protease YdiL (CAAX protease family)
MNFNIINDLINFFRIKDFNKYENQSFYKKLLYITQIWSFTFIFVILGGLFSQFILNYIGKGINPNEHAVSNAFLNGPIIFVVILASVLAPIFEELAFRLAIIYQNKISFSIGIGFFFSFMVSILLNFYNLFGLYYYLSFLPTIPYLENVILAIPATLITYLILSNKKIESKTQNFIKKYHIHIFWFFTIVFALIHSLNFLSIKEILFLIPLLVLPQFLLGYSLGFVRVKLGIIFSIIFHALNNFVASFIFIIISIGGKDLPIKLQNSNTTAPLNYSTQEYTALIALGLYMLIMFLFILGMNVYNLVSYINYKERRNKLK